MSELALHRRILSDSVPLLDVRAEIEFEKGHVPSATNVPILTTGERERVGKVYKQEGNEAAVALGHDLVRGKTKARRVEEWAAFADAHPEGYLHCWRGGMRSRIAQQWLKEAGRDLPVVPGGFKAIRRAGMEVLEDDSFYRGLKVVGGRTGSNKTGLILSVPGAIDLEGLAVHRGSGFGRRAQPQPRQVTFELALAMDFLATRREHPTRPFVFEDESRQIGSCRLPEPVWEPLHTAPLGVVVTSLEERVAHIRSEYVVEARQEYIALFPEDGAARHRAFLEKSLHRIRNRLGHERAARVKEAMDSAFDLEGRTGDTVGHDAWIAILLREYYDPRYDYQIEERRELIAMEGSYDDVLAWARAD